MALDQDQLLSAIDESLVLDLAKRVIEIPSPTGEEEDLARFLVATFAEYGLESRLQTIYEGRYNVVGIRRGSGSGPRVLWSGHMDTSSRGDEPWLHGAGWKNHAVVEDGIIWGNGIFNMKNAFVAYIAAIDALNRIGAQFTGDLTLAGVSGEIELAGVDEFTGHLYDSYGMGTRHLIVHGTAVDYHLLAEPTAMVPFLGNPGTTWAKVTVAGSYSHTAFSDHSLNSIEEMWKLWRGLDEWVDKYKADNEFGGIVPQVNRAAIRGGDPWRAARTPAHCSMYIDIRFPPDRFPVDVQREFEAAVNEVVERELSGPAHIEWYVSRPGTVLSQDHPLVTSVSAAHKDVIGEGGEPVLGVCVCSDGMDANRFGIPTLQYGAGRAPDAAGGREYKADPRGKRGESVRLDDISALAGVFSLATDTLMAGGLEGVRASRLPMPTGTAPTPSVPAT